MNQPNRVLKSGQIKKLKSEMDTIFDDAEKELQELLVEAQKLVKDVEQEKEESEKI